MSKTRNAFTLAAGLAILGGACWFVTSAFPLSAAPQSITDAAGVTVDAQGARFLHRSPVTYPRDAQMKGIEGSVMAQVKVDANGDVSDASILSGPDELRKAVLQSLLTWHFTKDAAGTTRQIAVTFRMPDAASGVGESQLSMGAGTLVLRPKVVAGILESAPSPASAGEIATIQGIRIEGMGVPDEEVLAKLPPLHVGDRVSRQDLSKFAAAVHQMDEHLNVSTGFTASGAASVRISAPNAMAPRATAETMVQSPPAFPGSIPVGGNVQNAMLTSRVNPAYPELAKSARISGTVELSALIGTDGQVKELVVISGHPLLRVAALDAVKQWVYKPTMLNGAPVMVSTTIDVVFSLNP